MKFLPDGRFSRVSIAILVMLTFVLSLPAGAQGRPPARADTLSARVRDSLIAAVLADTLDLEPDTLSLLPPLPGFRQTFTIRPTLRTYSVGNVNAYEQASYASWVGRFRYATLRLYMTPVSYTGDTSSSATDRPQVGFSGISPISGRLDIPLRSADTLRVFAQSSSFPGALSSIDAQALGAVGTSTIDLDAGALGVAARTGMRYTFTQALNDSGVALTLRAGVEYDPKPTGTEDVSWRGTTIRGAIGVGRSIEEGSMGVSVEMTRSYSDSLGGRNLFPGGGTLSADARLLRYFGAAGTGFFALNGFYSKPIDLQRPDVPTRIIPIGDFFGVTASLAIPVRRVTLLPMVSVLRETSNASALVAGRNTTLVASGQTGTASLGISIPLGHVMTVTPEVGGAWGDVGQTVSAQFPRRVRSKSFSDPIRGGWFAIEIAVSR
jgi:hypothetical protein